MIAVLSRIIRHILSFLGIVWEKIPDEVKKAIIEEVIKWYSDYLRGYYRDSRSEP
ncbi:MAG: hypothetical protein ACLP5H_23590 [Desulfomonilaceae bacterium]